MNSSFLIIRNYDSFYKSGKYDVNLEFYDDLPMFCLLQVERAEMAAET